MESVNKYVGGDVRVIACPPLYIRNSSGSINSYRIEFKTFPLDHFPLFFFYSLYKLHPLCDGVRVQKYRHKALQILWLFTRKYSMICFPAPIKQKDRLARRQKFRFCNEISWDLLLESRHSSLDEKTPVAKMVSL